MLTKYGAEAKLPQVPSGGLHSRFWLAVHQRDSDSPLRTQTCAPDDGGGHQPSIRSARTLLSDEPGGRGGILGQPHSGDRRCSEPMVEWKAGLIGLGGGISRAAAAELRARVAAPARGRTRSAAAGGAACGAVGGCRVSSRRPAFATMPGIDKLPIEETLEDSPQVRPGRRLRTARGLARAWSLRCPWPRWAPPPGVAVCRGLALHSWAGLEARAYSRGWATGGAETERPPLSPVGPGA